MGTHPSLSTAPFWQWHKRNFPSPNPHLPTKNCPKKLNKAPCTICYIAKMTTSPKRTTADTNNLQPGELIHIDFAFYNVTSIPGFTSISTVVCTKTIMIWVFPIASWLSPVHIIHFILTTLENGQNPWKCVRVDEYGALKKSTDVTKLIVNDFNISMETTGGDAS